VTKQADRVVMLQLSDLLLDGHGGILVIGVF
jgi:hypothetical protein